MTLSVIIIAKNEAANIERCLSSVAFADEIVVLDSGSTDGTVDIAKTHTDLVYETDWMGYGVQKQRALARATGDWVLNLDADEYVTPELKQILLDAMASPIADAYRIPIRMVFYGQVLRFCSSPTRHVRLFKRQGARYSSDLVHEKVLLPKSAIIHQIKSPILHHSFQDVSHALTKLNLYSSYSAKISIENRAKSSLTKTIGSTLWMFFRCYLLQRGCLHGRTGLFFALYHAQGSWYRGIKQLYPDQTKAPPKEPTHFPLSPGTDIR